MSRNTVAGPITITAQALAGWPCHITPRFVTNGHWLIARSLVANFADPRPGRGSRRRTVRATNRSRAPWRPALDRD